MLVLIVLDENDLGTEFDFEVEECGEGGLGKVAADGAMQGDQLAVELLQFGVIDEIDVVATGAEGDAKMIRQGGGGGLGILESLYKNLYPLWK